MDVNLFTPYLAQREFINIFADSSHLFGVLVSPRGAGKTLLSINLALYWLLRNNNSKLGYVTPIFALGKEVFEIIVNKANELVESSNKADLTIKFVNGSSIKFLSADRADSVRGFRFEYLILDEVAYIQKDSIENAILPTLNPNGRKCLMISTPRGKNHFYEYYLRGQEGNDDYISYKIPLTACPYVKTELVEEARKSLPREVFRAEYEAEFTDSTNDVFTSLENVCVLNGWTPYNRGTKYYAGIDVGISSDFSVITILDEAGRVAFINRVNNLSIEAISNLFIQSLVQYSVSACYVEGNGVGLGVYELISKHIRHAKKHITTQDNKMTAVRQLMTDIDSGTLELPNKSFFPHLYNELSAYTFKYSANGKISFTHPNGMKDDCIDSLWMANQARNELKHQGKNAIYISSIAR